MQENGECRDRFDLVIIGSGPGGYTAAIQGARAGMKVAVIEKAEIGGTYANQGCIPAKAMLHTATLYEEICQCDQFGLHVENVRMDFEKIKAYRDQAAGEYCSKLQQEFEKFQIPYFHGTAKIHKDHVVSVNMEKPGTLETCSSERYAPETSFLYGEKILVAVGAKPARLSIGHMDEAGVCTSRSLMEEESWDFKSVIVIGGGMVGTEFAAIFQTMGIRVTILEKGDNLMPSLDADISRKIQDSLKERNVEIHTGVRVTEVRKASEEECETPAENMICEYWEMGACKTLRAERVLVAAGRQAALEDLFDEDLIPQLRTDQGAPLVGGDFQTSIPGIYAVGDVLQHNQLAHTAAAQATYLVDSLAGKQPTLLLSAVPTGMFVNVPIVPGCIYTRPEIAYVGLTEAMAHRTGCQVRCGVYHMEDNSQSIISRSRQGMIKLVFAMPNKTLIGAQMICPRATDMIGEMATAIANGLTAKKLMLAMRAYPTYGEGIARAVENSGLLS